MIGSPYAVLGVSAYASQEDIKLAFRRLARSYHPDKGDDSSLATMQEINAAYDQINTPAKRRKLAWSTASSVRYEDAYEPAPSEDADDETEDEPTQAYGKQSADPKADISLNIMFGVVGMGWLIAIAAVLFVLVVVSPLILAVLRFIIALIEAAGS